MRSGTGVQFVEQSEKSGEAKGTVPSACADSEEAK